MGVDEDTVPIPQTAFKKFYDSVFGPTAAGADANAGTAGTQSSLGPGTGRAIPGEDGARETKPARDAASGSAASNRAGSNPSSWFNPEAFTKEKREWTRAQREAQRRRAETHEVGTSDRGITSPFEHFIVCGLPTDADVSGVAASRTEAKRAILGGATVAVTAPKGHARDSYKSAVGETYPARVLWRYPENVPVPVDDVASFCFPHGVEPSLLERTPSMSGLNDLVYGQRWAQADDSSFVWALRNQNFDAEGSAADEKIETLYGVCCYARELVQRRPGMVAAAECASRGDEVETLRHGSGTKHLRGRYLIAADRCYCLISKVPFFSMHFEVLHRMLGVDRLERIRACAEELWAEDYEENAEKDSVTGEFNGEKPRRSGTGTDVSPLVGRKLSYETPTEDAAAVTRSEEIRRGDAFGGGSAGSSGGHGTVPRTRERCPPTSSWVRDRRRSGSSASTERCAFPPSARR